ncbi:hypothetical protein [Desulfosporosinus sp. BG]|uniref:hypothetical protein n=1 Tax=Desulfosporosinus sp. BG TaxID=1633135 RepID=UPI00159F3214|nr:hypothetical protein [Desulfosporosinus sp. BG]
MSCFSRGYNRSGKLNSLLANHDEERLGPLKIHFSGFIKEVIIGFQVHYFTDDQGIIFSEDLLGQKALRPSQTSFSIIDIFKEENT